MNTNDHPIIFLAFANDYEGGYGYLPELASEQRTYLSFVLTYLLSSALVRRSFSLFWRAAHLSGV